MAERNMGNGPTPPHEMHDPGERHDVGSWRPSGARAATITRISWGAIFAGTIVALVVQLLFTMLGFAIGLTVIEPLTGQSPWQGIGIGAGIWWVISALISLFLGGWTAGRLAGLPLRQDAVLHGIVAWGLITLITLYLVITGVGAVIGGALNVVQQGIQSIGSVAPQAADVLSQPEVTRILQEAGSGVAADVTRQDLSAALQQFLQEDSETNRQRVINLLTERTQMSEAEARDTVAQLEQRYQQLRQDATNAAQEATNAVAMSAWWTFFALLAGAVAAAVGSALAAPRDLPAVPEVQRE
jgi:ElaB/YqjD/DUF883 family membrane-anchored ribosome-binding protein